MALSEAEILDRMRHIVDHPQMYGLPQIASGTLSMLGVLFVHTRSDCSLDAAFLRASDIERQACGELEKPPEVACFLSDEVAYPERKTSYEALEKHGRLYIELLESYSL